MWTNHLVTFLFFGDFFTDSYHGIHFRIWEMSFKHLGSKSKVFFTKRSIIRSYSFGGETNTRETHQFLRPFGKHQKLKPHCFEESFWDSKNHDIQVGWNLRKMQRSCYFDAKGPAWRHPLATLTCGRATFGCSRTMAPGWRQRSWQCWLISWESKGTTPQCQPPSRNKALLIKGLMNHVNHVPE